MNSRRQIRSAAVLRTRYGKVAGPVGNESARVRRVVIRRGTVLVQDPDVSVSIPLIAHDHDRARDVAVPRVASPQLRANPKRTKDLVEMRDR